MGRIRTTLVKSVSEKIYSRHKDKLGKSFEKNKKQVENFAEINSKKLRNTIVGYITKLAKKNTK